MSMLPLMLPATHPHFINALFGSPLLPSQAAHTFNPLLRELPLVETFDFVAQAEDLLALLNDNSSSNLSTAQRELCLLHNKMGHPHMKRLQKLLHHDAPLDSSYSEDNLTAPIVFRSQFQSATRTCSPPLCRACAMAKGSKVPVGSQHIHNDSNKEMALLRNHLQPGDCMSCDHYVVDHRGRLYHMAGQERETDKYCAYQPAKVRCHSYPHSPAKKAREPTLS